MTSSTKTSTPSTGRSSNLTQDVSDYVRFLLDGSGAESDVNYAALRSHLYQVNPSLSNILDSPSVNTTHSRILSSQYDRTRSSTVEKVLLDPTLLDQSPFDYYRREPLTRDRPGQEPYRLFDLDLDRDRSRDRSRDREQDQDQVRDRDRDLIQMQRQAQALNPEQGREQSPEQEPSADQGRHPHSEPDPEDEHEHKQDQERDRYQRRAQESLRYQSPSPSPSQLGQDQAREHEQDQGHLGLGHPAISRAGSRLEASEIPRISVNNDLMPTSAVPAGSNYSAALQIDPGHERPRAQYRSDSQLHQPLQHDALPPSVRSTFFESFPSPRTQETGSLPPAFAGGFPLRDHQNPLATSGALRTIGTDPGPNPQPRLISRASSPGSLNPSWAGSQLYSSARAPSQRPARESEPGQRAPQSFGERGSSSATLGVPMSPQQLPQQVQPQQPQLRGKSESVFDSSTKTVASELKLPGSQFAVSSNEPGELAYRRPDVGTGSQLRRSRTDSAAGLQFRRSLQSNQGADRRPTGPDASPQRPTSQDKYYMADESLVRSRDDLGRSSGGSSVQRYGRAGPDGDAATEPPLDQPARGFLEKKLSKPGSFVAPSRLAEQPRMSQASEESPRLQIPSDTERFAAPLSNSRLQPAPKDTLFRYSAGPDPLRQASHSATTASDTDRMPVDTPQTKFVPGWQHEINVSPIMSEKAKTDIDANLLTFISKRLTQAGFSPLHHSLLLAPISDYSSGSLTERQAIALQNAFIPLIEGYEHRGGKLQRLYDQLAQLQDQNDQLQVQLQQQDKKSKSLGEKDLDLIETLRVSLEKSNTRASLLEAEPDELRRQNSKLRAANAKLEAELESRERELDQARLNLHEFVEKTERTQRRNEQTFQTIVKQFTRSPHHSGLDRVTLEVIDVYERKVADLSKEIDRLKYKRPSHLSPEESDDSEDRVPIASKSKPGPSKVSKLVDLEDELGQHKRHKQSQLRGQTSKSAHDLLAAQVDSLQTQLATMTLAYNQSQEELELLKLKQLESKMPSWQRQAVSSQGKSSGADLRKMTRELIMKDKQSYRLKLFKIDSMTLQECRELLKQICVKLEVSDADELMPGIDKIEATIRLLPQMQQFVREIDSIVWSPEKRLGLLYPQQGRPRAPDAADDGTEYSAHRSRLHKLSETLVMIQAWAAGTIELEDKRRFYKQVHDRLKVPLEDGSSQECLRVIDQFFESTLRTAMNAEVSEHAARMVNHFRDLFEVASGELVFSKMNEVYIFYNEAKTEGRILTASVLLWTRHYKAPNCPGDGRRCTDGASVQRGLRCHRDLP
ncbi:uncharacterized protein BJ171DRAFT_565815 [Polychytrium aggregatum]|uniref:uncharacterized protein n=1 Tax=Polychytrium aggregatum TaxID=110093 RepID=UPI0022FEBD9D|nr:uncharacterized protein BJ171DRAFT_565815 [Polychytrium aggregatum]KAI9207494.1 hypothetical protein BJ171DRAFT_565815 [Polychytrium aggregatum]